MSCHQGRSQKFVSEGDKPGDWGQKSPSGVQGQNPVGVLGAKPPEAVDIYAKNNCNNALNINPSFFSMGISGGHVPLVPLPYAPACHVSSFEEESVTTVNQSWTCMGDVFGPDPHKL